MAKGEAHSCNLFFFKINFLQICLFTAYNLTLGIGNVCMPYVFQHYICTFADVIYFKTKEILFTHGFPTDLLIFNQCRFCMEK